MIIFTIRDPLVKLIMKYFIKAVTFLPDNENYTLSPIDVAGWYTLYPPKAVPNNSSPQLIYFDPLSLDYLGWTTVVPLNCQGNTNYHLGKCQLIYQRIEDSRMLQRDSNRGESGLPVGKGIIPVVGRVLGKEVYYQLPEVEVFCIFSIHESCVRFKPNGPNPVLPSEFPDWSVGFITYTDAISSSIVPGSIFGQYIKATIRAIGKIEEYEGSNIPHTITENPNLLPIVGDGVPVVVGDYTYAAQVLTFSTLSNPTEIQIIFTEDIYGSVPQLPPGNSLTISGKRIKISSIDSNLAVDLSNLMFLNTVSDFTLFVGNAKYTQTY